MTVSLRLDQRLSRKIAALAKAKGISKSELIRTCLNRYVEEQAQEQTAWELGKHLFGCFDSKRGDLSERAEEVARERIHARRSANYRR